MRSFGMPGPGLAVARRLALLYCCFCCLCCCLVACAGPAYTPASPSGPRPLGLPEDLDLEADRRTVHHTQSGGGAIVDRVALSVRNRSDRARTLKVTGVDRLHGSCDALGWDDIKALTVHEPTKLVQVGPAEALGLAVVFEPVECYNACDRFGFRVHVEVDGTPVVVDALLDVEREE